MAEYKPDQLVCISCGKSGTKDDFTVDSDDLCMNCKEETKLEWVTKSLSGLSFRRQKNDGYQLEKETGDMDRKDAVQGKERRSSEQLKEEKPVEELCQENVEPDIRKKKEMANEIESAIETNRYFYVGEAKVARKGESARDALYDHEGQMHYPRGPLPNLWHWLTEPQGFGRTLAFWKRPNHHDDRKVKYSDLNLVKIFCTRPITAEKADELYRELRSDYLQHRLCVNGNSADTEPETEKGIVYLRIYEHTKKRYSTISTYKFQSSSGIGT